MNHYCNATICLNGHIISKYEANWQKYCSECGCETFSFCKECGEPIHGKYEVDRVCDLTGYYEKPFYCHNCGRPYPWTQKILENAIEIISLDEIADDSVKQLIKDAIPNLIVESPSTAVAVAKYKKGIEKVQDFVKDSLRQLLIDVVSETIKKLIFP